MERARERDRDKVCVREYVRESKCVSVCACACMRACACIRVCVCVNRRGRH